MLFDKKALDGVRRKAENSPYFASGMRLIREECGLVTKERLVTLRETLHTLSERADLYGGGKIMRCGNFTRNLSILAVKLAFVYRLDGEKERLDALRQILSMLCGLKEWRFQGVLDGWNSDLWNGDIGANVAVAYDSIREELPFEERDSIEKALYAKSFLPIYEEWLSPQTHCHALDSMGHNWWSVCVAGGGVVLSVLGKPRFEALSDSLSYDGCLRALISGFGQWFAYPGNVLQNKKGNFGPDGDYIEHLGYLSYAFSNFVVLEELLRKESGNRELFPKELFEKIPDYFLSLLHISGNEVRLADFGDTPYRANTVQFLFYLAREFERADLLWAVKKLYPQIVHPYDLCFYPDIQEEERFITKAPTRMVYRHTGYAVLRGGYRPEDFCFIIKTGESWNHNHRDVGSFELSALNFPYLTDSGTCGYSSPLYQGYYVTPQAHNVVLFNGKGQPDKANYEGTKFEGKIPLSLFAEDYSYLLADCTGPYAHLYSRFYRHVIQTDGALVLIDDLETYEEGHLSFLLHYNGILSHEGNELVITGANAPMRLYLDAQTPLTTEIKQGHLHEIKNNPDDEGTIPDGDYLCCSADTVNCRQKFAAVFVLPGEESKNIQITSRKFENAAEIEIRNGGRKSKLLINYLADGRVMHRNATLRCGDVETDGALTYLKYDADGALDAIAVHNTSLMKLDGTLIWSSLVKCDAWASLKDGRVSANTSMDTECTLWTSRSEKRLTLLKGHSENQ